MSDDDRTRVRRVEMGFVYQFHQLLPEFSALENVVMPQMIAGRGRKEAGVRASELLTVAGPCGACRSSPRRAVGRRAAAHRDLRARSPTIPACILADEPTGNLDPHTAAHVFDALIQLIHTTGVAALIATHNLELAGRMDRVLRMEDGLLIEVPRGTMI